MSPQQGTCGHTSWQAGRETPLPKQQRGGIKSTGEISCFLPPWWGAEVHAPFNYPIKLRPWKLEPNVWKLCHAYMLTYMAYIHTYLHTHINTYIPACRYTYLLACIHTYVLITKTHTCPVTTFCACGCRHVQLTDTSTSFVLVIGHLYTPQLLSTTCSESEDFVRMSCRTLLRHLFCKVCLYRV